MSHISLRSLIIYLALAAVGLAVTSVVAALWRWRNRQDNGP
jgi:hypothetical protein